MKGLPFTRKTEFAIRIADSLRCPALFLEYLGHFSGHARKWYKAKDWSDVEKAAQEEYDDKSDGYKVSKLVLDPLSDCSNILPFATTRQLFCSKEGDEPDLMVYHKWRQSSYLPCHNGEKGGQSTMMKPEKEFVCKRDDHSITNYAEEGLEHEANCKACGKQVTGAAYTCKDCSLVLHKYCAEMSIFELATVVSRTPSGSECSSCKEDGENHCPSCRFETHLECSRRPTVIRHDCEEHFLSIVLSPAGYEVHRCAACGDSGSANFYSCKTCNLAYHYKCLAKVPPRWGHVHGDYNHYMVLKFSTEVEAEDYICDECQERRDPQLWFYSCEDCQYEAHLFCVLWRKDMHFNSNSKEEDEDEEEAEEEEGIGNIFSLGQWGGDSPSRGRIWGT